MSNLYCAMRLGLFALFAYLMIATNVAAQGSQVPDTPADETVEASEGPSLASDLTDVTIAPQTLSILLLPLTAEELADLATVWQGHFRQALTATASVTLALSNATPDESAALRTQLTENTTRQSAIAAKYTTVLNGWEAKGATPEDLAPHRTYISAIRLETVRINDLTTLLSTARNWALSRDGGIALALSALGVLAVFWIVRIVARFVRGVLQRNIDRVPSLSRLLRNFLLNLAYWATLLFGILLALAFFGVNVTPLFAVFGGLSFILAFALQETLGNLASGLMIMVLKPFDTGDFITVGGVSGTVDDMSVISTQLRTPDNQVIILPNSKVWGDVITNVSASPTRRVDMVFGIGYSDDPQKAMAILRGLIEAHPKTLKEPEAAIFVGELADNSVNIFARVWSRTEDYWTVYWDILAQAKTRFDAEGISIPFPQRDVHVYQMPAPAPAT